MECPICATAYDKKRKKICCSCEFECCVICAQTYILERVELPHCMSCKNRWTKQFLYDNFKVSFVNGEYREARKKILLENELAKLPTTQEYLKVDKAIDYLDANYVSCPLKEDTVINFSNKKDRILEMLFVLYRGLYSSAKTDKEISKTIVMNLWHNIIDDLYNITDYFSIISLYKRLFRRYKRMWAKFKKGQRYEEPTATDAGSASIEKISRKKFIHKCPDEHCKGFISTAYKCGLCDKFTCSKCLEIKQDDHVCNENSVMSAEIIKKSTNPCPKCGTRISRIHGCDQMWCTLCNTAFNWKTGAIYSSSAAFHNPHYHEWLASNPGGQTHTENMNALVNCGELIGIGSIQFRNRENVSFMSYENKKMLYDIHRFTADTIYVVIQKLRDRTILCDEKNTDLRIRYMKNEITKKHLSKVARMRDNIIEKNVALLQVLEIFTDAMTNQFNNLCSPTTGKANVKDMDTLIATANRLRLYCNKQFANINKNYKMGVYQIHEDFTPLVKCSMKKPRKLKLKQPILDK